MNNHENVSGNVDNVNNVTITFNNSAFAGSPNITALATRTKNDIAIDYIFTPPEFIYEYYALQKQAVFEFNGDGNFPDTVKYLTISIRNGQFNSTLSDQSFVDVPNNTYRFSGLPTGLTAKLQTAGENLLGNQKRLFIIVKGDANPHSTAQNGTFTLTLNSAILQDSPDLSGVASASKTINIVFDVMSVYCPFSFNKIPGFTEKAANDGSVENNKGVSIPIIFGTYSSIGGTTLNLTASVNNNVNFTKDTHFAVVEGSVPAGLTLRLTKTGTTGFNMFLDGNATSHANSDDTSFVVELKDGMFATGTDMTKVYGRKFRVYVNFND